MAEKDLQTYINNELRQYNVKFFHAEKSPRHNNRTHRRGLPDLIIWPGSGRTIFIELKSRNGTMKTEQIKFYDWAMNTGYPFYVVRNVDDWNLVKKIELDYIAGLTSIK
jgi:hypothetical protein